MLAGGFFRLAEGEFAGCGESGSAERWPKLRRRKRCDSARPREIPAGKYTVILEPAAVLDIVGFMFWDYCGHGDS